MSPRGLQPREQADAQPDTTTNRRNDAAGEARILTMPEGAAAPPPLSAEQAGATMRSKRYVVLLAICAVVGVVVSLAAWGFLELIHQIQQEVFTHLPHALGYSHGPPKWWPLPVLALGGVVTGFAIARLPGSGGHIPADGLASGGPPPRPTELTGIMLAAIATIGLGLVLGPEAPLIALGSGLGALALSSSRRDVPSEVVTVVAAAGAFAALSLIFESPLIAAVVLIEATGIGGARLPLVLLPGLMAAGIGSLISVGMGSFTGLSTSAYALGTLQLPVLARPTVAEFGWTIALAIVVAILTRIVMQAGRRTHALVSHRELTLLPVIGLIVAGLAIAFSQAAGKSFQEVLFSGQDQLPGLIAQAGTWSLSALALLIVFKGLAYALCLGSFRGGPTFPALFLGAAGGIMASHLAGFSITPAVAVALGAATVAVLRLPLTGVVIAALLTSKSGLGAEPLVIVGVVVSYLVTLLLSTPRRKPTPATETPAAVSPSEPAVAGGNGDSARAARRPPAALQDCGVETST
ncbi:MAG: chloride channel protein [Solirubrobacterales bacterium]|nr:chloride channel protein [Solirubrobacterales bacterium]